MSRHERRKWKREDINLYIAIIIICFLVAAVLHFLVDKGSDLVEESHVITPTDLSNSSIEELEESYGDKIDADDLEKAKKVLKGKMESKDIESLKETYKGKLDPADLKKLKETYKENFK